MESLHIHQDSNYNFSSIVSKIKVPEDSPAWASEITQQVKVIADKLDHLNSIPETHTVEGEKNQCLQVFFWPPHLRLLARVCAHAHTQRTTQTHTDTQIYTLRNTHKYVCVRTHTGTYTHRQDSSVWIFCKFIVAQTEALVIHITFLTVNVLSHFQNHLLSCECYLYLISTKSVSSFVKPQKSPRACWFLAGFLRSSLKAPCVSPLSYTVMKKNLPTLQRWSTYTPGHPQPDPQDLSKAFTGHYGGGLPCQPSLLSFLFSLKRPWWFYTCAAF